MAADLANTKIYDSVTGDPRKFFGHSGTYSNTHDGARCESIQQECMYLGGVSEVIFVMLHYLIATKRRK
jgi:hypothetical protein